MNSSTSADDKAAKKILIVSPFENFGTGRGNRNLLLAEKLIELGHDVIFATSNFDHAKKKKIELRDASGPLRNVQFIGVPGYSDNISIRRFLNHIVFAFRLFVRNWRVRYDAVVVSSIPPEVCLAATCLWSRVVVVDVRDIWPEALQSYGSENFARKGFRVYCELIYSVAVRRAALFFVVAPSFGKWISKYKKGFGGAGAKVKFVPLGFRREDFCDITEREFGVGILRYGYAGGVTPQFDIREFAPLVGNESGVVVGSGPLLDKWKVSFPGFRFLGATDRASAMNALRDCDVLLFPANGFALLPNKAFDYFALGKRVLVSENASREVRYLLALRSRNELRYAGREQYRTLDQAYLASKMALLILKEVGVK